MSEEYYYNRSENLLGVSNVNLATIAPSYGMTVKFKAENKTMNFSDGYFKKTPHGLNSLKAVFNFSYEADHDGIQKIANKLEELNSKAGFTNSSSKVLGQNKIYKNFPGFVNDYSINHQNKNRYELSTSLSVEESPNLLNWKSSSFLNVNIKTWEQGVYFEKDDIVYLSTNTSKTTNFRLGNIFYCKKDHKSVFTNKPGYGRGAESYWTQDFEWQPDEKFETSLNFNSEKFGDKFKTRKKQENAVDLDFKPLFSSVSDKQALAMLHFLETRAGYRRFRYQIPSIYNRPKIFISESWEHKWNYDNNHTISIDLIEDKLGVISKEKEDNYYTQGSFYRKKFSTDYLSDSERFGYYDGANNWFDYQVFFSDFDDQSSNPDDFYVPPITQLIFNPGDINSGVFGVDTKSYIGASVEETISTDIPDNWKLNQAAIDGVSIGTSCTSIGSYAFRGTSLDQQLFIPPTVTGINEAAFWQCNGITGDLFIPPSVVEIGKSAFYKLYGLTDGNIFISDDSLKEPVTSIGSYAFYQLGNFVGNLIIGNGVKSIGSRAFERVGRNRAETAGRLEVGQCTEYIDNQAFSLSKFTGPLIIEDNVIEIGTGAFLECFYFDEIYLGSALSKISDLAFFNCYGLLGDLTLPESLRTIGWKAFENCDSLDGNLNINSKNLEYVGDRAFYRVENIKSGDLNFGPQCEYIGAEAFYRLVNWDAQLFLPTNKNYDTIEERSFFYLASFTSDLEIPSNVKTIGDQAFSNMGSNDLCGLLTFNEGLETINHSAFRNAKFVGDCILPDSVTSIGSFAFAYAKFDGVLKLPPKITEISDWSFYQCKDLTGPINIPYGVTTIGPQAFDHCYSVSSINIPDTVTSIGAAAFRLCRNVWRDVFIPDLVTAVPISCFESCENIRTVRFSPYTQSIGNYAFRDCFSLDGALNIPDSVTSIGNLGFSSCRSLDYLNFADNSNLASIGNYCFNDCLSLKEADFEKVVTPFTIGNRSFQGCTELVSVNFGSTVTSIGAYAFRTSGVKGSNNTNTIVIPNSVNILSAGAFQNTKINYVSMSDNVTVINNDLFSNSDLKSTWDLTGVTHFGNSVLSGNENLTGGLYLPNSVTTFGSANFGGNNLTTVSFSPSITVISNYAFSGFGKQSELTNISHIGPNVTSVGSYAFACPNLKDVYFPVSSAPAYFANNACNGLGSNLTPGGLGYKAYFHVPVGATGYGSVFFPNYVQLVYDL